MVIVMEEELYRAAVRGDIRVISKENIAIHGESYYRDQTTPQKNNIIHIAANHGRAEFLQEALAQFPELGYGKNGNQDTPLHVAANKGYGENVRVLVEECPNNLIAPNSQGDTPLHLALRNNHLEVAMDLLNIAPPLLLSFTNAYQETPLHVFLKYCIGSHTTLDSLLEEGVLNLQGVYKSKVQIRTSSSLLSSMPIETMLTEFLKYKEAAYMPDANGLTPLLIAAQQGSFLALQHILKHCPQSVELCDPQGRTLLHHLKTLVVIPSQKNLYTDLQLEEPKRIQSISYLELKKLLSVPEIDAIKDAKDSHGNTPAHIALANQDFVFVKVLFECFADFTVKNNDGVSPLDLTKSFPNFASKMEEVTVTQKVLGQPMDEKLFRAAKQGDSTILKGVETDIESGKVTYSDVDSDYFTRRTNQGFSILHLAVKYGYQTFMEETIKHFPTLVLTTDLSGESPLHVGARLHKDHYPVAAKLLELTKCCVDKFKEEVGHLFLNALPWRQKNSKGNTPLHEALQFSNFDMAIDLVKLDPELSSVENNAGETPLHILARYSTYTKSDKIGALVEVLLHHNERAVYKRDSRGFTPLLGASYYGRIRVAFWIIRNCPASIQFRDAKDRTFLHFLRLEPTAELDAMTTEDMLYTYTNMLVLTSETECDGCQGPSMMPILSKYKDLRKLTGAEFGALRSSQDHGGNTPLLSALKNRNFGAAKLLLHWCIRSKARQELSIINNEGQSALDLLEALADDTAHARELKDLGLLAQKKIREEAFGKKMMDTRVYMKAAEGNQHMDYFFKQKAEQNQDVATVISLDDDNDDKDKKPGQNQELTTSATATDDDGATKFLCQVAPDGSNILHVAFQHQQVAFAQKLMQNCPDLLWERNYNGDTPLHTFARVIDSSGFEGIQHILELQFERACGKDYDVNSSIPSKEGALIIPPWRVKNCQGNTVLHEMLELDYLGCIEALECFDSEVATYVNHNGETPLHPAKGRSRPLLGREVHGQDDNIRCAMYVRDREGLTPLLRAAKASNDYAIDTIFDKWPESIQMRDHRGRSFLHLFSVQEDDEYDSKSFYKKPIVDALRRTVDFDRNTPLHSAIQAGNTRGAKFLAERFAQPNEPNGNASVQLSTRNNEGNSILDLMALHDDTPTEVLQLLLKTFWQIDLHGLYVEGGWVRSGYGVCKSQIKDVANTLSVVAGLLATITFAAAFQVPGGFKGESGSPVLLHRATFKTFMISNSFAMCGSMTVLFCLLWVMLTGSVTTSFVLLDLSITVLQLSFGATLLSFMTGVYVATSSNALWLAIFICGLCSTISVLLRKNLILSMAQAVKRAHYRFGLFWYDHVNELARVEEWSQYFRFCKLIDE